MNNMPVSVYCLLHQKLGIMMTILKLYILGLDCSYNIKALEWNVEVSHLYSNLNYKSNFLNIKDYE